MEVSQSGGRVHRWADLEFRGPLRARPRRRAAFDHLLPVLVGPGPPHPQGHRRAGRQGREGRGGHDRDQTQPVRGSKGTEEAGQLGLVEKNRAWRGVKGYQTSRVDLTAEQVISAYRQLLRIEKTFRMSKSDLKARPITLASPSSPPDRRHGRDGSRSPAGETLRFIHQAPGQDPQALPHLRADHRRADCPRRLPRYPPNSPSSSTDSTPPRPSALNWPKSVFAGPTRPDPLATDREIN